MTPAAQPKKMTPLAKSSMGLPCLPCPCAFVEALTKPFHHEALMKPFQSLPRSGGFRLVAGLVDCSAPIAGLTIGAGRSAFEK